MAYTSSVPTTEEGTYMDCTECGAVDGMSPTNDLLDNFDRKCGQIWTCACGAEYIDEWGRP